LKQATPKVDPRTAPDVFRQVVEILNKKKDEKKEEGPGADGNWGAFQPERGVSGALIKIFARFAELITDRLNRVPEKNFLAFLDLLGASLLPPRSARAPLTFSLAEQATASAIVPAGTQVAAAATEGESEPAVFETESELVITPLRLTAAFSRTPANDSYANHLLLLSQSREGGSLEKLFQADTPIEHILYIAHDRILNHPGERTSFAINLTLSEQDVLALEWDKEKNDWIQKRNGRVTHKSPIAFDSLNASLPMAVNGIEKRWLTGAITSEMSLADVKLSATFERKDRAIESAFTNSLPVDTHRGFYPFGESPKPGDAFYLKIDKDFAEQGCTVTLNPTLDMVGQAPTDDKPRNAAVVWEFWDGATWSTIGAVKGNITDPKIGSVEFAFPKGSALTNVNGVEGHWVRARLNTGSFGPGAEMIVEKTGENYKYRSMPAAAPLISSIKISYVTKLEKVEPEAVLAYNDFTYEDRDAFKDKKKFIPFRASRDAKPTFYLGFETPAGLSRIPNSKINLYITASGEINPNARPEIEWQYSTGALETGWASLAVIDDTADFTRSGVLEFLAPPDFAPRSEFGSRLYWLRAVLKEGEYFKKGKYSGEPQVSSLLFNTVMARHATRIENEVLGSSAGSKNQTFRTSLAPVLEGQRLEVRELEMPSPMERDAIKKDVGEDAILTVEDEAGRPLEIWVRWKQVPDFYGSGPRDRHYVLDHLAGEVRFGDGISGMIPPTASGNIRMTSYRTGGGTRGNKPAGAITDLRTAVPYVESVTNHIAASGGAEAETYDALLERMPRMIRHGGRAVTYEDYEDLARLASPETARARCVRIYEKKDAGTVSLIVVPRSADPKPVPSLEMKRRVKEFIDERKSPLARLTVDGPEYVDVNVRVEIAPTSLEIANEVKMAVLERLNRFLHPLVGGFEGTGWGFGRKPHKSDLYYLIEAIPGLDHIISLEMKIIGTIEPERYLIASGTHEVNSRF
jgi:hypothetical protein